MTDVPTGSNADEWGTAYCAVQIAEAIEAAEQRGYARGIEEAATEMDKSAHILSRRGLAAEVQCYENESHHTPDSRDRDARLVGHEVGPDRLGGMSLDAVTHVLTALRKSLYSEGAKRNSEVVAINTVLHMIPHLLAERDTLEAKNEGALAIITQERVEVLKLREENQRLMEALTPSGDTKAAYIGEFRFPITLTHPRLGEETRYVSVPWTSIKEIMAMIRARAEQEVE